MLVRFVAKNIYSFNEETEFNLLPNRSKQHLHHKIKGTEIEFLRYAAIYGANGAGKSNLVKAIAFLKKMVVTGKVPNGLDRIKFKLSPEEVSLPVSFGIEIFVNSQMYYYSVTIEQEKILHESLLRSYKVNDELIFERTINNGVQNVQFASDYSLTEKQNLFTQLISEKLLPHDELMLSFLSLKFEAEFPLIKPLFEWFTGKLQIITPDAEYVNYPHYFDSSHELKEFANKFISSMNLGISALSVKKRLFNEGEINPAETPELIALKERIENNGPGNVLHVQAPNSADSISCSIEENKLVTRQLLALHHGRNNKQVEFNLSEESDGTVRLLHYLPALQRILNSDSVFIIDEIERSIHPLTIKQILTKLSLNELVQGQLIFTTHETNLLDLNILRSDEIWFAQKNRIGASELYPLSDFTVHNTISVENGYLAGRFGAIPFLSDFRSLNWEVENAISE